MALSLLLTSSLAAHDGVFVDPNHYIGGGSFAGTRYLVEETHQLTLIGGQRLSKEREASGPWGCVKPRPAPATETYRYTLATP